MQRLESICQKTFGNDIGYVFECRNLIDDKSLLDDTFIEKMNRTSMCFDLSKPDSLYRVRAKFRLISRNVPASQLCHNAFVAGLMPLHIMLQSSRLSCTPEVLISTRLLQL